MFDVVNLRLLPQVINYLLSHPDKKQSYHDKSRSPLENYSYFVGLRNDLIKYGVVVEDVELDIADFDLWLVQFGEFAANYKRMNEVFIEKCLEHYLSYTFLNLDSEDVFIDVAAAGSPYVEVLSRLLGNECYRLDLSYPPGVNGKNIGANAGQTLLPTGFADALALHCAFECFMGEDDRSFVAEASRLLSPRGRYVIAPLYLDSTHFIATSPYCNQEHVLIDPGAIRIWRDDKYKVPFSRHYSPAAFAARIHASLPCDMLGKVFFVKNLPEVMKRYPDQRLYSYFIFYCEKHTQA